MPTYPVTSWFSTLGYKDSQDIATRGYLRALQSVGYEHVNISPRGTLQPDEDLEDLLPMMNTPEKYRRKIMRVKKGDPRVGKEWEHLKDMKNDPGFAPPGYDCPKFDPTIRVGDYDHDYYKNREPEEKWAPKVDLVVCHYDPGQLVRARDAVARASEGEVPIVGITTWETSKLPLSITQQLSDLDMLIVPSEHAKQVIRDSGLDEECPIEVIPHTITMKPITSEEISMRSPRYLFYTIGTDIPRKNLEKVIAAYILAFKGIKYKDVGLIVKTNGTHASCEALKHKAAELAGVNYIPRIPIIWKSLSDAEIRLLHVQGDCWVDATSGEGFGLGQAEASIMGNKVITTGWGAQVEIPTSMILTDYEMAPVDETMAGFGPYRSDQLWADPKLDSLIENMREAFNKKIQKDEEIAKFVAESYSLESVGHKLSSALEKAKENF